jgi:hypothetical protein
MSPTGGPFLVARNPDPGSSLPYLLRVPVDEGLALKAREAWPATARVYCHPLDHWPADAEVLEEVTVRTCRRRGRAIDLVLDRGRNNRSQFVFTEPRPGRSGGRTMVFWQTPRTAQRARPGQRAPARRASGVQSLLVEVDSRERYPYKFAGKPVERRRGPLPCGDYAVLHEERVLASVERKTLEDLAKSLVDGSLAYALAELAGLPAGAVVVEARYADLLDVPRVRPGWLCELVAQLQVRHPSVPLVFCDSRKLGEDYTYRFLAAASTQLATSRPSPT